MVGIERDEQVRCYTGGLCNPATCCPLRGRLAVIGAIIGTIVLALVGLLIFGVIRGAKFASRLLRVVGEKVPGLTADGVEKLSPYPETQPRAFTPRANAWVVGIEPIPNDTGTAWPYRAALAPTKRKTAHASWNFSLACRNGSINT